MIRLVRDQTKRTYLNIMRLWPRKSPKQIAFLLDMKQSLVYKYLTLAMARVKKAAMART